MPLRTMPLRIWFRRTLGVGVAFLGLILTGPWFLFVLTYTAAMNIEPAPPIWMPWLLSGMAIVGVILIVGGFKRMSHALK